MGSRCVLSLLGIIILTEVFFSLSQKSSKETIVDKNKDISRLQAQVCCFINLSNQLINFTANTSVYLFHLFSGCANSQEI